MLLCSALQGLSTFESLLTVQFQLRYRPPKRIWNPKKLDIAVCVILCAQHYFTLVIVQSNSNTIFDLDVTEGQWFWVRSITVSVFRKWLPMLCLDPKSGLFKTVFFKETKKEHNMKGCGSMPLTLHNASFTAGFCLIHHSYFLLSML